MRFFRHPTRPHSIIAAALMLASAIPAHGKPIAGVVAIEQGDFSPAVRRILPLAERGDPEAQYELGTAYYEGQGVAQDLSEAAWWWRQAAEQGHVKAQFNLGVMYYEGNGVRRDAAAGVRLWRAAATQGHLEAQYNLGLVYSSGRGVPVDYGEAAKWYRMAAVQGGKKAQYNLGVMYAKGEAFPADYVQAHAWFSLAAEAPPGELRDKAVHNRDVLSARLTAEQRSEAERLARELLRAN